MSIHINAANLYDKGNTSVLLTYGHISSYFIHAIGVDLIANSAGEYTFIYWNNTSLVVTLHATRLNSLIALVYSLPLCLSLWTDFGLSDGAVEILSYVYILYHIYGYLGVLFDSTCSVHDHMSKICKSINYNLYSISKIHSKYLNTQKAEKMVNCSMTSRPDCLYGSNGYLISYLQLCQNNTARVMALCRKFDDIAPDLKDLHWLHVEQIIKYKVFLLTYKALHGKKAPAYLCQLLSLYTNRRLWSETKDLTVPRCRLEGFGRRCFTYADPSLWNHLSTSVTRASSIDAFKSSLKAYLFNMAYHSIHWLILCLVSGFYLQALLSVVTSHHFEINAI